MCERGGDSRAAGPPQGTTALSEGRELRAASERGSTVLQRRRILAGLALAPALGLAAPTTPWPSRPLRIIVVYPTGGLSDDTARAIADKLSARLQQKVLIDNRAGGGGSVGMNLLAKAAPDGHTLAYSAISPLTLTPHLMRLPYDAQRDIAPVISLMLTPVVVIGTPAFAGNDFASLLQAARARPGQIRWATSGAATVGHMVLEQVRLGSGTVITHIPYKGGGQQLTDALAGQFEVLSSNVAAVQLQHIHSGRFRALAVGAPSRLAVLPQVPTLAELGLPQANLSSQFGIFAPARTPAAIIARLNAEFNAVLRLSDFRARLTSTNNIPGGGSAAAFATQIATESRNNRQLIEAAGIKLE